MSRALAIFVVLLVGCGERSRTVHVHDARVLYDIDRGDVTGQLLVDAVDVGTCSRPWWLPEVVCAVDAAVTLTGPLRLELALDIGSAAVDVDLRSLAEGRHLLRLDTRAPLVAATIVFDVRVEPWVPLDAAIALAIVIASGIAFAVFVFARGRLASNDDPKPKGGAITLARVTSVIAQASIIPVAAGGERTEPLLLAIPTLFGVFAAAITVGDAIAKRRLGSHRVAILLSSIVAAATMPLIVAMTTLSLPYVIALVVVMALVAFF